MTDRDVSDEMLMALADGEIEGEEAEALLRLAEADATVAARLASFRRSRRLARDAYSEILREVPDERLATMIERSVRPPVAAPSGRRRPAFALPLAASLLLAAGLGYWLGSRGEVTFPMPLSLDGDLIAALDAVPSGGSVAVRAPGGPRTFTALATYPVDDGACRIFRLAGASGEESLRGLACRDDKGWRIEITAAETGNGAFSTASDAAVAGIEAWLDAAGAGASLSAEAEAALIAGNWPGPAAGR